MDSSGNNDNNQSNNPFNDATATLSPTWSSIDTYPEIYFWAGPGTIAAFTFGFAFFVFLFIMIMRVSLALSRTSANRRVRMRNSAWVTTESGQGNTRINTRVIRLPRTTVTNSTRTTNHVDGDHTRPTCPDAPPLYEDICFSPPPYNPYVTIPPHVHQENKTNNTT